MKSSNVHAILSEVYRLLGNYVAADFIQASEYKGITPHLRESLRALAREAQRSSSSAPGQPIDRRYSRPNSVVVETSRNERPDLTLDLVNIIRRSKRFDSNLSILQFAKEVGLKVLARPKESRERLARRVAEAISLTPEPRRSQIVAQLAGNGDNQTQGWIDVIRAPGSEHHASIRAVASTDNCLHRGCQIDHKGAKLRPRLAGARSIILRVPLLVGIGQQSVAMLELRRFMELVCWTVYFSDHPVEWRSFEAESGTGFSQDTRRPVSYSAHRELGYYIEYARELMNSEASGLGIRAVDGIKQVSHELNAAVHAGQMAQATIRKPPHEDISDAAWRKFGGVQRRVFSSCCILLRNGVKTW